MSFWRPTPEAIQRIHFCLINGKRSDVIRAILRSLDDSANRQLIATTKSGRRAACRSLGRGCDRRCCIPAPGRIVAAGGWASMRKKSRRRS